jgi:hypothetical protein
LDLRFGIDSAQKGRGLEPKNNPKSKNSQADLEQPTQPALRAG